jgi:hypothetical protein
MSEERQQQARTATRAFFCCARVAALAGLLALAGGAGDLSWPRAANAEQPKLELLASRIHVLHHASTSLETLFTGEGIWSFSPETGVHTKLAPYSGLAHAGSAESNAHNRLQPCEDRLLIQSWPGDFHLDAVTFRLLRRTPPFVEPELYGWALYGPVVCGEALGASARHLRAGVVRLARP